MKFILVQWEQKCFSIALNILKADTSQRDNIVLSYYGIPYRCKNDANDRE